MLVPRVRLYRRGMTIPEQYKQAVSPHIMIDGAAEAITFYTAAFDASEHLIRDPFGHVWIFLTPIGGASDG